MSSSRMENVPFSGIREILEVCTEMEQAGRNVIHLEIGRPDLDTPQPIKDAAIDAIRAGHVHYTSNYGHPALRKRLSNKFDEENSIRYDPDQEIIVTAGAAEALFVTFLALIDNGDEALIPDPSFPYGPTIRLAGGIPVQYQLNAENGYQPDFRSLEEQVSSDTKLLVVNSPQNPTGSTITEQTLWNLRDFVLEHDLLVVSDEIYEKIRYEGTHYSPASVDELFERTITVNGFSKAYSMTGWRLGYLGAPKNLADPIIRARQYTSVCSSSISQHAGIQALKGAYHRPLVETFETRRDLVVDRIESIDGLHLPNQLRGAFYALPEITLDEKNDRDFALSLLRDTGVAVVPGSVFGRAGAGTIRIAYSNSIDQLETGFDRLEEWLENR